MYPIAYLDAMHFKIRSNWEIVNKAIYIYLGYDMDGYKDILGIWVDEVEGAKFCLGICNDLKNRGVKKILIAYMNGLKRLSQAIKTVFPSVNIQTCIIHQIRKIICTTNILEEFNRQICKFTKVRITFPTDESLNKCVYLATMEIMEKWTQPIHS